MNLIPISDDMMINVERISVVEQVFKGGKATVYIICDGERYQYEYEHKVPIGDFINIIRTSGKREQYNAL